MENTTQTEISHGKVDLLEGYGEVLKEYGMTDAQLQSPTAKRFITNDTEAVEAIAEAIDYSTLNDNE